MISRASFGALAPVLFLCFAACSDEEPGAGTGSLSAGGSTQGGGAANGGSNNAGAGGTNAAGTGGGGTAGIAGSGGGSGKAGAGGSAGTAGKAGAGGSAGTAGKAGGGGSAGAGGKAGAGGSAGSAGKAGAGGSAGAAGKAGAGGSAGAAGKAGAGGTAGKAGAGGSAGAAGKAGAGGSSASKTVIGSACEADASCGPGGTCLLPTSDDFLGGGPTHGLCVKDCSKGASTCGVGTACVPFGANSYCVETCTFGVPFLSDESGIPIPEDKCHGRLDVSCSPLGATTSGVCVPRCWPAQAGVAADYQCPSGTACDPTVGVCLAGQPADRLTNGSACDPNAPARQCEGDCIALDDPPTQGLCVDPCVGAVAESCGGLDRGLCFFDTSGVTNAGKPVSLGVLDVGGCAKAVEPTADASCYPDGGIFPFTLIVEPSKARAYCLTARSCTTDDSCIEACKVASDCSHADALCTGGACTVNDTCKDVGAKKYCLDHTPTVP